MASNLSRRDAENQVIQLCHSSAVGADLRQGVLRSLRRMMTIDAAFFAKADPDTLLTIDGWAEQPLDTVAQRFMENEFGYLDVNKFAELATSPSHVSTLDAATRRERLASARYREIMRPLGLGDELRAALTTGDECWGYLCLHREDGPLGFSRDDAAVLARLAPHIAQALRREAVLGSATTDPGSSGAGVVILATDLTVLAMTPQAEYLLSLIEPYGAPGLPLPVAVYSVAIALAALDRDAATIPSAQVPTRYGQRIRLDASRLQTAEGLGHVAIVVELVAGRTPIPRLLSALGLTTREAEVATLVLRGHSTQVISDELHISCHTVQDHLKRVFDKVGVRSRRDLIGRLLTR